MLRDNDVAAVEHIEPDGPYNDLFEFSPSPVFILDENGIILKANMACEKMFGIEIDDLINKSFSRYIDPGFQDIFSKYLKLMKQKMLLQSCEIKLLKRFMPIFYASLVGKARLNAMTDKIEYMIIIESVSNRKSAEELAEPLYADSSNTVNHLMITYLNQPLAIIGNYINGCIHRLVSGKYEAPSLIQGLKQAGAELHRTAEIIMRMKNFSCKGNFKYESVCLNSVIQEIIDLMNIEVIDYPVLINFRPIKGLPNVVLDKIYVQQAILNLVRNAIEAMCDIGMKDPKLTIEINRPNANYVAISIIDIGPGLQLEKAHKLFDPHYTTKSYGTGLGMIISRIIVESHGGGITVELNPTRGACITIELPMMPYLK